MADTFIGRRFKFNYPPEFTLLPTYTAHTGQEVLVLRQATDDECDPASQPIYVVQAADGWIGHANPSELEVE